MLLFGSKGDSQAMALPLLGLVSQVTFYLVTSAESSSVLGFLTEACGEARETSPSPDVGSKSNHLHVLVAGSGEP